MKTEDFDKLFDNLSYGSRKEIVELRDYCKKVLEENEETIYKDDADSTLHQFRDRTGKFAFNIAFSQVNEAAGNNYYNVYYNPSSLTTNIGAKAQVNFEQLKIFFDNWLTYVLKMHEVTEEYYNPYAKFYNEEFKDFFINTDEDCTTTPFDKDRQEVLYYFLTYAETQISKSEDISDATKLELTENIKKLKKEIPYLTKKEVVTTLNKIALKVKRASNDLFHLVFDVLKKEIVKKILYKGAEYIPDAIEHVKNWLHYFQ